MDNMSTKGEFNPKSPTTKRILKEASELANNPSSDYHAEPLEDNLFEWHFTLRGPPAPSPFDGGLYHGRISLPTTYPLRPPSFRFLTASGRFEVNREICLSISGHHEETWQPAWGIRTALVAIRSFMDTGAKGQIGGIDCDDATRKRLARAAPMWTCGTCKKSNAIIMATVQKEVEASASGSADKKVVESVPEGLTLKYPESNGTVTPTPQSPLPPRTPATGTAVDPSPTPTVVVAQRGRRRIRTSTHSEDVWLDKAIYGVSAVLVFLVLRKLLCLL